MMQNTTAPFTDDEEIKDVDEFNEDEEELEGFGLADEESEPGQSDMLDASDDSYWNAEE